MLIKIIILVIIFGNRKKGQKSFIKLLIIKTFAKNLLKNLEHVLFINNNICVCGKDAEGSTVTGVPWTMSAQREMLCLKEGETDGAC